MYTTYTEVTTRYPMLITWANSPSVVSSDLIYFAEMELNSRLSTHFTMPFSADHPTIKDLAIDLSYYKAINTRDPEKAGQIHKSILGRIDDIKAGKEFIYTGSGTVIMPNAGIAASEIWATTKDYHPVHSMLDAGDAATVTDQDRLDDEEDERE